MSISGGTFSKTPCHSPWKNRAHLDQTDLPASPLTFHLRSCLFFTLANSVFFLVAELWHILMEVFSYFNSIYHSCGLRETMRNGGRNQSDASISQTMPRIFSSHRKPGERTEQILHRAPRRNQPCQRLTSISHFWPQQSQETDKTPGTKSYVFLNLTQGCIY